MAREAYESLFGDGPDDLDASPFLRAMAREGRVRRSARDLAQEDFLEGTWATVTEEEGFADLDLRMAAEDGPTVRIYADDTWRIVAEPTADGFTFTQHAGPGGATVELDGDPPQWVPLVPGEAVAVRTTDPLPSVLVVLDARGRRIWLESPAG